MTLFTSTISGDFNDGATWGNASPGTAGTDFPLLNGGDTFIVSPATKVTIPAGVSVTSSGAINNDVTDLTTALIINGSFVLDGNLTVGDIKDSTHLYASLILNAGASLDLNNNIIYLNAQPTFTISGTSSAHCQIKSTAAGGTFANGADGCKANISWSYLDMIDLGDCSLNTYPDQKTFSADHITATDCGSWLINTTPTDNWSLSLTNIDFRGAGGSKGFAFIQVTQNHNGLKVLDGITAQGTTSVAPTFWFNAYATDWTITNSAFHNATPNINNIDGLFSAITDVATTGAGAINITNSYFYDAIDNAHLFVINKTSGPLHTYSYNIIEHINSITDGSDYILLNALSTVPVDIHHNILIDDGSGNICNSLGYNWQGAVNLYNNTVFAGAGKFAGNGVLFQNETKGYYSGGFNVNSNLVVDRYNGLGPAGLFNSTSPADQITFLDNNNYFGIQSPNPNTGVVFSAHTYGDAAGYGLNDKREDPAFTDNTVNLAAFDLSLGGPGTANNAITEFLKLNGYGGSYNPSYNVVDLITFVRNGFTPTNALLSVYGLNNSYIGAIEPVNKTIITSSSWNIQTQQAYNIAWNLLTSVDHATAWNIINALLTVTSWNIKTSNVSESAWNILVSLESNTAWNLLTSSEQQIAWNILTDLLTDTAWNIISGKILKLAQRMIYSFDTTRRILK